MTDNKYRLIAVDIDGTLMGKDGTISDEDRDALRQAAEAGVRVSLSTGRVVQASRHVLERLSLDGYHIFFDGAFVYSPDKDDEVYVSPIPAELVRQMTEYAHGVGLEFDLYSSKQFFAEKETWATDIRRDFYKIVPTVVDFEEIWDKERFIKGTLVVASDEDKAKARDFYNHFRGSLNCSWSSTPAYPGVDFINVITGDVSKGKALEKLAVFLGIETKEVMAIGDGANDLSLLAASGLAVAMENAPDELKTIADYVTADVHNSGVAAAVRKYIL